MAVMNDAYAKFKAPQMIGNFDATQFIMSGSNEEMLVTVKKESDFQDNILESKIYAVISLFHPNIPSQKRHFISKGIVKVVKSLAKVVNFQIVTHGFNRIGVYPLCAKKCLSNCDPGVLKQFNANDVSDIITKIPALA